MNEDAKKTALRMIPYGMYVLTTKSNSSDEVDAATVNWVTQTSFNPPLVAVGVKADSKTHQFVKDTNVFAVNVISGEQINPKVIPNCDQPIGYQLEFSECAELNAFSIWSSFSTKRMPLPPPPAEAFNITGYPAFSASSFAS